MRFSDVFSLSFRALKYRKLRSFLTMLGVIIGSSLIIVLTSQTSGLSAFVSSQFSQAGVNTIYVIPTGSFKLSSYHISSLSSIDGVDLAVPIIMGHATVSLPSGNIVAQVVGVNSMFLDKIFPGLELNDGFYPGRNDYADMVVGYNLAFPVDEASSSSSNVFVGEVVPVKFGVGRSTYTSSMVVSGITESYGSMFPFNVDNSVLISLEAADSFFNRRNYYSAVILVAEDISQVDSIVELLDDVYHNDVRLIVPAQISKTMNNVLGQMQLFLGLIAAVSLIVASVGIANIMFISVIERTRFIGLFKALGATGSDVLVLFLSEATMIGLIGGIIGCVVGIISSELIGSSIFGGFLSRSPVFRGGIEVHPVFTPEMILISFGVSLLSGLIAGFYPAYKASKMDPVKALREE